MPTYYVKFSGEVEFEADSYDEAQQKAYMEVPLEADEWYIEEEEDE